MPFLYNTTGSTGEILTSDDLTSQINGTLQQFTTSSAYTSGTLRVYYNGVYQRNTVDFEELTSTTFRLKLNTPQTGEDLIVEYSES